MAAQTNLNGFYLANVIHKMAPYFQLNSAEDVSRTIALQQVVGARNSVPSQNFQPPREIVTLVDLITNTSEGAYQVHNSPGGSAGLLTKITELITGTGANNANSLNSTQVINQSATGANNQAGTVSATQRLGELFQIYYAGTESEAGSPALAVIASPTIRSMLGNTINSTDTTQAWHKCSIFKINTPYVNPANKYTEAISVYMNGIPSIEIARAVPYIDIKFISGRDPTDASGRLNSMSIFKFLEGAVQVSNARAGGGNAVLQGLVAANTISGSIPGAHNSSGFLSETGMELFTTTQTMINANTNFENDGGSLRAVPVLDPFRPFLTFKSLNIDITSGGGFFAYKTGKLEFVLHDRSRLSEIADFIKPDLYGTTNIMIEFGWMHPDSPHVGNLYADLLNASRSREQYMIRNVSFTFDDVGQVNITLDVAMRGGSDLSSEVIATAEGTAANAIRQIRTLAETINRYRSAIQRTTGTQNATNQTTTEIRGVQILDAAADYQNNIRLSPEFLNNLRLFRTYLGQLNTAAAGTGNSSISTRSEAATALIGALDSLWGSSSSTSRSTSINQTSELTRSLAQEIQRKIQQILAGGDSTSDPMLPSSNFHVRDYDTASHRVGGDHGLGERSESRMAPATGEAPREGQRPATIPIIPINTGTRHVSLAKLLLHFVAIPLAETGKFDDVQLVFYPFNDSAGFAKDLNIGQFVVDVNFFMREYTRFRTETISRAASINLRDFMAFIANTIIDDVMAPVYGISSLYSIQLNRQTGVPTPVPTGNQANFQVGLETLLRGVTPNAEFKQPTVQCYVEALPARRSGDGQDNTPDNSKTVLRLHIMDRQASLYQTQGAILAANRNQALSSIGTPPDPVQGGEPGISRSREQYYSHILSRAVSDGIVGTISPTTKPANDHPLYVVNGGPKAIKDFVMKTMPYIIYGTQGSAIKSANLSSQQNPDLSTVNMLRSLNSSPLQANGEQPGGLPLSIIPCELSMTTLGCNLIEFTQQFFIDFQTGTSADNIYGVNAVTHKLEPGLFETDIKFVPLDAYGAYNSYVSRARDAADHLRALNGQPSR